MSPKTTPSRSRRACTACTRAKRSCSKQLPRCSRCQQRDATCSYPPHRPTAWDFAVAGSDTEDNSPESTATTAGDEAQDATASASTTVARRAPASVQDDWFYDPDSWVVSHGPIRSYPAERYGVTRLRSYIGIIQEWLRQWVSTGSCPFIHRRLYGHRLPVCVQDAFTALSAYNSCTPATADMCHHIIKTRMTSLVRGSDGPTPGDGIDHPPGSMPLLDPFNHLARVHALFVYQMVGLWSGDISLQGCSEQNNEYLITWAREMIECAELDSSVYSVVQQDQEVARAALHEDPEVTAWKRWILYESIRRTWMMIAVAQGIYMALKRGWTNCDGGVKITPRAGVWDADDAFTWGQALANGSGPLMVHCLNASSILDCARPEDLDEFSHMVLKMQCGKETLARWKAASSSVGITAA